MDTSGVVLNPAGTSHWLPKVNILLEATLRAEHGSLALWTLFLEDSCDMDTCTCQRQSQEPAAGPGCPKAVGTVKAGQGLVKVTIAVALDKDIHAGPSHLQAWAQQQTLTSQH